MPKFVSQGFVDGGITAIRGCNRVTVLSSTTATPILTDITTTYKLATIAMTANTDIPASTAGSADARIATVAQKASLPITASGTALWVAIDNGTDFVITSCASQVLTLNGTVTVPSWTITVGPSA
jgi:hypothetical protein